MKNIKLRYQREIERLEKDNKRLKKSLLLRGDKNAVRKEKVRLLYMKPDILIDLSKVSSCFWHLSVFRGGGVGQGGGRGRGKWGGGPELFVEICMYSKYMVYI